MKTKTIKNLLIISAATAAAITVPIVSITTINNNNQDNKIQSQALKNSNLNLSKINSINDNFGFAANSQETISKYNASDSNIPMQNVSQIANIANNMTITVPSDLTIATWKMAAYNNDGINGTGAHINASGNIGGLQFLLNNQPWNGTPFITWSYTANMSPTTIETPQPIGQNFIYIRVFPAGSNAWFGVKVTGFSNRTISKYEANDNIATSNLNDIANIANNMTITVPDDLTIAAWKMAAYNDNGINGTLQGAHINANGNVGGLQFLLNNQAWNGTPFITWSYTADMSPTTIETPQPIGQNFIYIRVFPEGSNIWFGVKVTGFSNRTISKYEANDNIATSNLNDITNIANSVTITVPDDLTIAAWKMAAYNDGINGTLQGAHINANGNVGGLQFLLNNQAWNWTPFITWSYTANMSPTTIETPQPIGQNFIYIRVFPTESNNVWFDVTVKGFANRTISKYEANDNIATSNLNDIANIANNMTITVPSDLTIAAWKMAAYNDGINGTLQGAHINANGNVGGLQFLLNNQAWNGTPFITWSYTADMWPTTIETPQTIGQNFIYIRVFPAGSNAWFGLKVTGFANSVQNISTNSLVTSLPSNLTTNVNAANFYPLQVNSTNISSLLLNLPQLPVGFNYIYSISNNNSTSAISNGTLNLNIQVYSAIANTTSYSRNYTLTGFRQGIVLNPSSEYNSQTGLDQMIAVLSKDATIYAFTSGSSNYISNLTQSVSNILINGQITPYLSFFNKYNGESWPNYWGTSFGLSTSAYNASNYVGLGTSTIYLKVENWDGSFLTYTINNLQSTGWFLQSLANGINRDSININSAIKNINLQSINQSNLSSYITLNKNLLPFYLGVNYNIQLQSINNNEITIVVLVSYNAGTVYSSNITIPISLT